tara:strand:+ start:679 stop:2085 length:1407 start_codon:yes stop_codon:yes gene_type:complete
MRKLDREALDIVDAVNRSWIQTSEAIHPVGNIFMVFAHDLVIHFTGILIHREAKTSYNNKNVFPYVNKTYALSPFEFHSTFDEPQICRPSLKSRIRSLSFSRTALGEALPLASGVDRVAAKWINLFASQKEPTRVFLPRINDQIEALHELISTLASDYGIKGRGFIWKNWNHHVTTHASSRQSTIRENGLLIGTRNNLQNRKLAANFLQQGKEVVAITHGEVANSVMDEPPFGYSERTMCSTLIDYGNADDNGCFNQPWIQPPNTLFRSGQLAKKTYKPSNRIRLPSRSRSRILYIPTTYHGNNLYGPFHAYEDSLYRKWQASLFNVVPELVYKVHPKSWGAPLEGAIIERESLDVCISKYDILVFDYFATGAMLALVSEKPVIYFDIGLRNLRQDFLSVLKQRCEYLEIDIAELESLDLTRLVGQLWSKTTERSNEAISSYVFARSEKISWKDIFSAVNAGKSPRTT